MWIRDWANKQMRMTTLLSFRFLHCMRITDKTLGWENIFPCYEIRYRLATRKRR
jgi:hypothetical protein